VNEREGEEGGGREGCVCVCVGICAESELRRKGASQEEISDRDAINFCVWERRAGRRSHLHQRETFKRRCLDIHTHRLCTLLLTHSLCRISLLFTHSRFSPTHTVSHWCIHTRTHKHTPTHAHAHAHTHTRTHTHIYTNTLSHTH